MQLKPYFSVDIETTGLDPEKDDILSLAVISDTGDMSVKPEDLPFLYVKRILHDDTRLTGTPFAFWLNANLIKECLDAKPKEDGNFKFDSAEGMGRSLLNFLFNAHPTSLSKTVIAGKNAVKMDIPFIDMHLARYNQRDVGWFKNKLVHHRVIDVGSLWLDQFGEVPGLSQINKLLGRPPVAHDAYGDALDVVYAIRAKFTAGVVKGDIREGLQKFVGDDNGND